MGSTISNPVITKKRGAQLQFDNEWTLNRIQPNDFINDVRSRVDLWRKRGYEHVTPTTRRLLEYWSDENRENRVLFAQREAAETAIYLTEAAAKDNQGWMLTRLDETNETFNVGLPRVALKMATGSGLRVVMAMLLAWQVLNKAASPNDKRFSRRFFVAHRASPSATGCECCAPSTRTTTTASATWCRPIWFRRSAPRTSW